MSRAYGAVLFDLFDTLVHFDPNRLPVVEIAGKTVRSSAGRLLPILNDHAPSVTLEACYDALRASWQEAERLRAVDHREVTAPERMGDMLQRLAVDPAGCPAGLVESMLDAHRAALSEAVQFPAHYRALLRALKPHYRLAVVSNFDYTPTAVGMLRTAGVARALRRDRGLRRDRLAQAAARDLRGGVAAGRRGSAARPSSSATAPTSTWWAPSAWGCRWPG